jgi:hypothetical protein
VTTIAGLVHEAFQDEAASSHAQEYLKTVRENMKDLADGRRRSLILSLLVVAAFELIDTAAIADVQLGPLKVTRLAPVQEALPVLFSFLMYDIIVLSVRYTYCEQVCLQIVRMLHEPLSRTELDRLTLPFSSSLFGVGILPGIPRDEEFGRLLRIVFTVTPYLLIVFMLVRTAMTYRLRDPLLWASTALSIAFFSAAIAIFRRARQTIANFP